MTRSVLLGFGFLFLMACAHNPQKVEQNSPDQVSESVGPGASNPELKDAPLPIPHDVNPFVQNWLDYFQGKGRRHMERYLARSTRYIELMKSVLRENGVPEEMVYVALIESGFSFSARSHANAVGYWQFIRGTAKRYGLKVSSLVDERRDPVLSTAAAAQYLKGLYQLFGSWELSLAAYNVGENRVQRVINSNYTRDYWEMARRRMLPAETLSYVPKFIAASMIASNPEKYGFTEIEYYEPFKFEEIELDKPVNLKVLAGHLDVPYSDFKLYNPAYRTDYAPLNSSRKLVVRVPVGQREAALVAVEKSFVSSSRFVATLDRGESGDFIFHRVRRGDTLGRIASRYNSSIKAICKLNGISPRGLLRVGGRVKVPGSDGDIERSPSNRETRVASAKKASSNKRYSKRTRFNGNDKVHIVRRGETLTEIAKQYNISIAKLTELNQISRRAKIFVGSKLIIPN